MNRQHNFSLPAAPHLLNCSSIKKKIKFDKKGNNIYTYALKVITILNQRIFPYHPDYL